MSQGLSLCLGSVLCCCLLLGCVRNYKPPGPDEPHALVKLRRVYLEPKGPLLREHFEIAEYQLMNEAGDATSGPRTQAVRVRPGPLAWKLTATYFHHETRMVQESYTVQEPYTTSERYQCGTSHSSGTYSSPRYCSRTVTKYRSKTKYRTVPRTVEVSDGSCEAQDRFVHREGLNYLIQYRFSDDAVCRLTCLEQQPRPDGSFDSTPCQQALAEAE